MIDTLAGFLTLTATLWSLGFLGQHIAAVADAVAPVGRHRAPR